MRYTLVKPSAASLATVEAWVGLRTDPDRLIFEIGPVPREAASLGDFAEDLVQWDWSWKWDCLF